MHGHLKRSSMRATRLLPLLLVACLLACTAEAIGVRQLLQTRSINVAWTIGLNCKHPWLKNATYSFIDKLGNASLNDLKAYPGVSNAKFAGKGPCRDIIASWNAKMKMAGYMYAFTFTGTADVQKKLLTAARQRGGSGWPDRSVWTRTVELPMTDLRVQGNGKPMRLRANNGSTLASPTFSAGQYAIPAPPPLLPSPSPSPKPSLPSPSPSPRPSPAPGMYTCANVTNGSQFFCPTGQVLKPNPSTITSPNATTCCNPTCSTWACPPGYALVANANNITALSNSTCCALTSTCADIDANSTTTTPFSCPAGWVLKSNASSISNLSNTTCCDVAVTCGNVNATSGTNRTQFACPAGYVLKPNATSILSPNVTTCCEATRTCANTNLTASTANPYLCPLGWQLKANASSIVNLTDSSCCDARATCANTNTNATVNGSTTGVLPFTCPNGFALPANASNITAVNTTSCCVPLPTCTNIRPNLTNSNITIPYTCPPDYGLLANASNVTVLSNATCCEFVPVNCTLVLNSLPSNASNTCQCTKPGYQVKAMDGNVLKECLPSPATSCTAVYPIVVRTADPVRVIDSCLTANTSACPEGFPLMQFSGTPLALQECRPSTQPCVAPYDLPVTTANTLVLLGCVRFSDNTCPMGAVAYREYNSLEPWSLQQCRVNGTCNNFISATDRFAVPALSGNGSIVACLTLDPTPNSGRQQVCPAAPGANFPVDVTQALPAGCGGVAVPCTAALTVMCLASNATCPQAYPFQLVRYNTPDVPGVLAGCRSGRALCDLFMASMRPPTANGADPNAPDNGNYTINLRSGTNLVGCVQGGASACPSSYAYPLRSSTGALQECNTNGTAISSCPIIGGNPQNTVEAENQNGAVIECLSPFEPCPPSYPVAARILAGTPQAVYIEKCIARSSAGVCPASFPFPFFAPVPNPAAGGASVTALTNCWKANVVTACNFQVFNGPQGYGVGSYTIEIRQNSTSPLQGCMLSTTKACPAVFNFAFFSSPNTLVQCVASGSCQASGSTGGLYTIPLMDQGNVTGCGTSSCPEAFPVTAGVQGSSPVACLTTLSQCDSVRGNYVFSLFKAVAPTTPGDQPVAVLDRCLPSPAGLTVCDAVTGYTGLELYNSLGALVGCTTPDVTNCPPQFPFAFYDTAGSLSSCRTNITGTCSQATGNNFPAPIYDDKGRLAGCAASSSCTNIPGIVILSESAISSTEYCITVTRNACPPAQLYNDRSFPLYSGTTPTGAPRLVRCIRSFASPECSTTGLYSVRIKNTMDGSGNVIGCMTASPATPCPVWSPFSYYAAASAGTPAVLQQCTVAPAADARCQTPPYTRPVAESDTNIVGCLLNSAATTVCPTGYGFGLPYLNAAANPPSLVACRLSTQATCPTSGYGAQAITTVNGITRLDACLSILPGSSCPAAYPVFAQDSLPYPSAGVAIAMCLTAGSSCPTSAIASQNFPFNLWSNGVVQGCLAPQVAFTSCTGFAPFNGAGVLTATGAVGCQTPSTVSCPAGLLPFWDISKNPPQMHCRPALASGQTCLSANVLIGGISYTTNLRAENGIIIGCLSAGSQCPSTGDLDYSAWVAPSFAAPQTNPTDCLPATTPSCPSLGYTPAREFALYKGISVARTQTTLALPKLFACVPRATTGNANDCTNYGNAANTFSAAVWSDAGATNLVGCAVSGGVAGEPAATAFAKPDLVGGADAAATDIAPCPSTAPFFLLGSVAIGTMPTGAAVSSLAPTFLVECRPASRTTCTLFAGGVGVDLSRYIVEMRDIAGNLVGCKELTASAAQTGCAVGSASAPNGRDGYPYDFNFPIVGNGGNGNPQLSQCRKTLSIWPSSCAAYTSLPGTTAFNIPLLQGTTIASPAAESDTPGVLVGCLAASTRCPSSSDLNIFACTYGQGIAASRVCGAPAATTASAFNGFPVPLLSTDGSMIVGCRWNGLGGGDVTTAITYGAAPASTPDAIAVQCTANSGYAIAVASATYTVMVANTVASPPDAGLERTGITDKTGQNVRACIATGANAAACYKLSGNGFPFNGVGSTRFIQSIETGGTTTGTLVGCAPLTSNTACTAAGTFSVFSRSAAGATPEGNFMSGCATGTTSGATNTEVTNTQTWVNGFYSLFSPPVTASAS